MAEKLRELRLSRNIPAKEMVDVVRKKYPKYDKTMQSKCERSNEYGVQIKPDAMKALYSEFAPEMLKKGSSGHRLKCRISCRLEDAEYEALQEHIREDGFDTMQDWLSFMVRQYLKGKEQTNAQYHA